MKIRTSFVSNSSSSSYVCDITGEAFEVQDSCFRDAGLCQCPNGHVFKLEFLLPLKNEFPPREKMLADLDEITDSKAECAQFRKFGFEQLREKYSEEIMNIEGDDYYCKISQCPLCTLTRITDSDLLTYIFKTGKATREIWLAGIRTQFGTDYEAFKKYINSK